eukprot:1704013-Pleurochrysis_carterae.AAC.1
MPRPGSEARGERALLPHCPARRGRQLGRWVCHPRLRLSHRIYSGAQLSPAARACSCCGEGCFVETPPITQSSEACVSQVLRSGR